MSKPHLKQTAQEEPDYSEDNNYPVDTEYSQWAGPGWYWGIYINNENDYWNHYNNHYNHDNNNRRYDNQRPDQRGDRGGRGDGGGRGEGGGGHGGGGHR